MSESAEKSVCLGTKSIQVRRKNADGSFATSEGMAAIFQINGEHLRVVVTDSIKTFQGQIRPSETKIQWERHDDDNHVKILSSFLMDNDEHVSYDYTQDDSIKLVLREKLPTGLVRIVWSNVLEEMDSSALAFCRLLGTCVNDSANEIQQLNANKKSLESDLLGWKDTAEKLEGQWQTEKDSLLHRFLELQRATHKALAESNQEVERLKKKVVGTTKAFGSASTTNKKKKTSPKVVFQPPPDDADELLYTAEQVNQLAEGQRTHVRASAGTAGQQEQSTSTSTASSARGTVTRRNPATGAIEVWDNEDADNDQEPASKRVRL